MCFIFLDRKVLYLGLIQSLFEGSMYVFVLEWTPALTNAAKSVVDSTNASIPHGFIFATYMVCLLVWNLLKNLYLFVIFKVAVMIGSNLFKLLSKVQEVETFMRGVLFVSCLAFSIPVLFPNVRCLNEIFFFFYLFFVILIEPSNDFRSIYCI